MKAEFLPATENAALKQAIIDRMERAGGISFRDYMAMALYHPGLGYYCSSREKMGREGDYLTSPEVSPVFGAMVGRQLRQMWELMARPQRFQMLEVGAGTGALARDILAWARRTAPEFLGPIEYTIVEPGEALTRRQRALADAEGFAEKIRWCEALAPEIEGCILSNELLDAMPVHRVTVEEGRLQEVFVCWNGARFVEELRPAQAEIAAYFQRLGLAPGEGCRAEVNLEAVEWMRSAARALRRGFILTLDYGYEAEELYAPWRREGTLLCFYRHNPSNDPYARIGRQDVTSHVDFTSVGRAGQEAGLRTLGNVSQSQFLENLGIAEALALPEGQQDMEDYYARRRAVTELLDPGGLGRIRVVVEARDVPHASLRGLSEGRS